VRRLVVSGEITLDGFTPRDVSTMSGLTGIRLRSRGRPRPDARKSAGGARHGVRGYVVAARRALTGGYCHWTGRIRRGSTWSYMNTAR